MDHTSLAGAQSSQSVTLKMLDQSTLAPAGGNLLTARRFAAEVLEASSRADLARIVLRGDGDDFPEVKAALAALDRLHERIARQDEALRVYADPDFWEDDLPNGSLALHDRGEVARNALAGKRPFFHRD